MSLAKAVDPFATRDSQLMSRACNVEFASTGEFENGVHFPHSTNSSLEPCCLYLIEGKGRVRVNASLSSAPLQHDHSQRHSTHVTISLLPTPFGQKGMSLQTNFISFKLPLWILFFSHLRDDIFTVFDVELPL